MVEAYPAQMEAARMRDEAVAIPPARKSLGYAACQCEVQVRKRTPPWYIVAPIAF